MRLIDADALKKAIDLPFLDEIKLGSIINNAPTIEPKHGKWITNKLGMFECTACNTMIFAKQKDWSFCPYCGAKMDKERE